MEMEGLKVKQLGERSVKERSVKGQPSQEWFLSWTDHDVRGEGEEPALPS